MKERYGINMEEKQYSKLLGEIPAVDIVITMGCNVSCPFLPCEMREDWGLDDPSGEEDAVYLEVMDKIEKNVRNLRERILAME